MDHKEFLQKLPAEAKARLTLRSDMAGLKHLVGHLGAIVLLALYIGFALPLWWLLLPVQGVLIVFLFTLEHEATHKTPFASERLNEAVGHLCGFLLLLPFQWFRYFHLAHHRWTNIADKDPELASEKPATLRAWQRPFRLGMENLVTTLPFCWRWERRPDHLVCARFAMHRLTASKRRCLLPVMARA